VFFDSSLADWLNCRVGEKHKIACISTLIGASAFIQLAVAVVIRPFSFDSGETLAAAVGLLIEVPVVLLAVKAVDENAGWHEAEAGSAQP
jgi:ACR3 family arsenite transporter